MKLKGKTKQINHFQTQMMKKIVKSMNFSKKPLKMKQSNRRLKKNRKKKMTMKTVKTQLNRCLSLLIRRKKAMERSR